MATAHRFRTHTVRTRLFLALVAAMVVLIGISALVWRVTVNPRLRLGVTEIQREVAMPAADQVEAFLEHHLDELSATLELSRFWREDADGRKEVLRRLLKLAPTLEEVRWLTKRAG